MEAELGKELYRECMRNHAAILGTYATDGCGEYTPDETIPGGLQCAACGCHRNFHRKLVAADVRGTGRDSPVAGFSPSASDERTDGKRRSRTRFSEEQKEKMMQFAGKIGWKLQRKDGDEAEITQFCREIGVSRHIFRVWMHNHKNSTSPSSSTTTTTIIKDNASSLTH